MAMAQRGSTPAARRASIARSGGRSPPESELMNRLFLGLAAILLLLVGIAAAKDSHDRGYLSIQDQYRKDHPSTVPGVSFDSKVQQLFPAFADAKRGDTFRVERCISCHVPDIEQ